MLEHLPAENRLLIRAGVGWPPGIVGEASVGADLASPAGFALKTGKPVISNHLENEERFRTPELLVEHGIRRAMNVILQGDGSAYGVLEVDSRDEGEFGEHDIAFLQGAANLLGMAIERQRIEGSLRSAVEQREILLQELDHRVSNSLQLVMSMLHLQAGSTDDADVRRQLQEASNRIAAIARAHRRLQQRGDAGPDRARGLSGRGLRRPRRVAQPMPIRAAADRADGRADQSRRLDRHHPHRAGHQRRQARLSLKARPVRSGCD